MTAKHVSIVGIAFLFASCTMQAPVIPGSGSGSSASSAATVSSAASSKAEAVSVLATDLKIPWDIAFLPDGDLLVTERPGTVVRIGADTKTYPVEGVRHAGEGGLLGIALHPDFASNHFAYLYMTTTEAGIQNKVERYTYENDRLTFDRDIIEGIPAANNHDGGRIAFGPDGYLYVTTGDAQTEANAQDTRSLAGKILRLKDDGSIPMDNPFGNAVYSYGHRNPQGLAWDSLGQLWATEHGRSVPLSGYDEVNKITKGANYGWPTIQGDETREGMTTPFLHSGASSTWAPASAAIIGNRFFFGGLRGEALYETNLLGTPVLKTHLKGIYGRIRTVDVGPDGFLYLTTSNTDGRGSAKAGDDRIIRVNPDSI